MLNSELNYFKTRKGLESLAMRESKPKA